MPNQFLQDIDSPDKLPVKSPQGLIGTINKSDVDAAKAEGYKLVGDPDFPASELKLAINKNLAAEHPITAGAIDALSSAGLGIPKLAVGLLGGPEVRENLGLLESENPLASTLGSAAGSLAPMGLIGKAGSKTAELVGEGLGKLTLRSALARKVATSIVPNLVSSTVEGGIYGLGTGTNNIAVNEEALGDPVLAAEMIAANMGIGGAIGLGIGGVAEIAKPIVGGIASKLKLGAAKKAAEGEVPLMGTPAWEEYQQNLRKTSPNSNYSQSGAENTATSANVDPNYNSTGPKVEMPAAGNYNQETREHLEGIRKQLDGLFYHLETQGPALDKLSPAWEDHKSTVKQSAEELRIKSGEMDTSEIQGTAPRKDTLIKRLEETRSNAEDLLKADRKELTGLQKKLAGSPEGKSLLEPLQDTIDARLEHYKIGLKSLKSIDSAIEDIHAGNYSSASDKLSGHLNYLEFPSLTERGTESEAPHILSSSAKNNVQAALDNLTAREPTLVEHITSAAKNGLFHAGTEALKSIPGVGHILAEGVKAVGKGEGLASPALLGFLGHSIAPGLTVPAAAIIPLLKVLGPIATHLVDKYGLEATEKMAGLLALDRTRTIFNAQMNTLLNQSASRMQGEKSKKIDYQMKQPVMSTEPLTVQYKRIVDASNHYRDNPADFIDKLSTALSSVHHVAPNISAGVALTASRANSYITSLISQDRSITSAQPWNKKTRVSDKQMSRVVRAAFVRDNPLAVVDKILKKQAPGEMVADFKAMYPALWSKIISDHTANISGMTSMSARDRGITAKILGTPTDKIKENVVLIQQAINSSRQPQKTGGKQIKGDSLVENMSLKDSFLRK